MGSTLGIDDEGVNHRRVRPALAPLRKRHRRADDQSVEGLTRLSRLVVATLALTGLLGLVSGCTRSDGNDDIHCEHRSVRPAKDDGSLASALAQQAADNQAYRECIERHGFRWAG